MTLNSQNALCCRKDASFGAHCSNLNEDRPILSATIILVSRNIRFMGIFMGFFFAGASNESGVDDDGIFGYLATSSESSEIRPAVLYGDMLPFVGR